MVKTTPMDDETHTFFKKTQLALFEKYKVSLSMAAIMADISHALRHPEEAARIIFRTRHTKHGSVISNENGTNGDHEPKLGSYGGGELKNGASGNGESKLDDVDNNLPKPSQVTLAEKEDINI